MASMKPEKLRHSSITGVLVNCFLRLNERAGTGSGFSGSRIM
jgi:hypothetical protein